MTIVRYKYKYNGEEMIAYPLPNGGYRTTHFNDGKMFVSINETLDFEMFADPIPDPTTKFTVEVQDAEFGTFIVICAARDQAEAGRFVSAWLTSIRGGKLTERAIYIVDHDPTASLS